jgi:hypothetical protein
MGIYPSGVVEGVRIIKNDDELLNEIYNGPITKKQVGQIKLRFDSLTEEAKTDARILFYMECSSTYPLYTLNKTKTWIPENRQSLEELFRTHGF